MSDKMFPKRFNFNAHIEEFADFVFRVNGQSFKVHRVTLAGAKEILNIICPHHRRRSHRGAHTAHVCRTRHKVSHNK